MNEANEVSLSPEKLYPGGLIEHHVTDLVTGFAGRVVQQRDYASAASRVCVAPDPHYCKPLAAARYIDVRRLRVDLPIRRRNAPPSPVLRYSHDAQQAIVAALWDFAANLQLRPHAGMMAQRKSDFTYLSLIHVETALDQILAGLGYVKAAE